MELNLPCLPCHWSPKSLYTLLITSANLASVFLRMTFPIGVRTSDTGGTNATCVRVIVACAGMLAFAGSITDSHISSLRPAVGSEPSATSISASGCRRWLPTIMTPPTSGCAPIALSIGPGWMLEAVESVKVSSVRPTNLKTNAAFFGSGWGVKRSPGRYSGYGGFVFSGVMPCRTCQLA